MGTADRGGVSRRVVAPGDAVDAGGAPSSSPAEPLTASDGTLVAPCSIRILGPLEVGTDRHQATLGGPKQRALLAILVLHANEVVPTERLIELVWGEIGPRTAAHSVQIYVSELRKAMAVLPSPPSITTRAPGYVLEVEPDSLDVLRFARLAREGNELVRNGHDREAITRFRHALDLWRGAPLTEFAYEEFAQTFIQRLDAGRVDVLERLGHAELACGHVDDALRHADAAIDADPLHEEARALQLRALYASGRHVAALRTYEAYRHMLADELGVVPSPSLQRLHERILLHDPELAVSRRSAVAGPAPVRNPYKGLRAFREEDAGDFFGRDALVDQIVGRLRDGASLVALVGPSGSGKSSVLAGGLIPAIRAGAVGGSEHWLVASTALGTRPLEEVTAAIARASEEPAGSPPAEHRHVLAVLDQFEELFMAADEHTQRRFLDWLVTAVTQHAGRLTVVLAMRADHYDRPLRHPDFAELFSAGVLNALPMNAFELEAAVVRPAAGVGVDVEPTLLAELLTDAADQPGSLPLLQYALTEQFERAEGGRLTVDGYRALGGLRAVLARRAEAVYEGLTADEQQIAMQVLLRMVRLGHGTGDGRRRVLVAELASLDIDPVGLSDVLARFGTHRLLAFDRDTITGAPTVEVAHEALLTEWTRLAGWLERHRAGLRKLESFQHAALEWEESGRAADYLLTGSRLTEFETWSREGLLSLTADERTFLDAGLAERSKDEAVEQSRTEAQRRLRRRARIGLVAIGAALVLVAGSIVYVVVSRGDAPPQSVALVYHGGGEVGVLMDAGFRSASTALGVTAREDGVSTPEAAMAALEDRATAGVDLIIDDTVDTDVESVARRHPSTHFAVVDQVAADLPNIASYEFATGEGSYLAGIAAALRTKTGTVGFIGGVDEPLIWRFAAGYEAGARSVDPTIQVVSRYLSQPPEYALGFENAELGQKTATEMYQGGADVIFAAAGTSGFGVFQAAVEQSAAMSKKLWAIGVDSDQYNTAIGMTNAVPQAAAWSDHILTSVVKRYDRAMAQIITDHVHGDFTAGHHELDLANNGVELAFSGGFIEDIGRQIAAARASIASGQVQVPCVPSDRRGAAPATGDCRS